MRLQITLPLIQVYSPPPIPCQRIGKHSPEVRAQYGFRSADWSVYCWTDERVSLPAPESVQVDLEALIANGNWCGGSYVSNAAGREWAIANAVPVPV